MSTVIYRLKTISVNIYQTHFNFIALFAQNVCSDVTISKFRFSIDFDSIFSPK